VFWQTYPPGSDIGFHAGVINSISNQGGNVNFLWNPYQMGGEVELEFPGYHIFALTLMTITGMPNYMAQGIVAVLLSSFTILAAYLVTRTVWNETAAIIAAFFLTVSRLDIEILCWSGYPNLTVLFLMPVVFYLFLKKDALSPLPFLATTSILSAAILLTHSLSTAVYLGITAATALILLLYPKLFGETRKISLYLILPLFTGATIVSPFLASAVSPYLNASAAFTGATAIQQALVDHQTVPTITVLILFASIPLFFVFSKLVKKQFFSFKVLLLVIWLLVPLLLTQSYRVGFYVDYIRFPYFLIIPVISLIAVTIDYFSTGFIKLLKAYQSQKNNRFLKIIGNKKICASLIVVLMLASIFYLPFFILPAEGFAIGNFHQALNDDGYRAIEWTKQNTLSDAMFVSDANYGWWLAGLAQRPVLSAVDLRFLTLAHEANIARNASYLLDTDYVLDNGYIQVREDGGYLGRHNPLFLADLNWTNTPYVFFQFNNSEKSLLTSKGGVLQQINLTQLTVVDMQLVNSDSDSPCIIIKKENNDVSYTEITSITKGCLFANMTITIQSRNPTVSLDWLNLVINSAGTFQQQFNNTLVILDAGMKECGQLIFVKQQPVVSNFNIQNPCITQLSYNLQSKKELTIQIFVGIYPATENDLQNSTSPSGLKGTFTDSLQNLMKAPDLPLTTFDYQEALKQYNVSYIENRDFTVNNKFASDPKFNLVFINPEVAIFKVKG
jgi:hypothetical protein